MFSTNCSPCHGKSGEGLIGPNLTDEYWIHGATDKDLVNSIAIGIPEKGMIAWKYRITPNEIGQLVAYLKSIKGTNPINAKSSQGTKE